MYLGWAGSLLAARKLFLVIGRGLLITVASVSEHSL